VAQRVEAGTCRVAFALRPSGMATLTGSRVENVSVVEAVGGGRGEQRGFAVLKCVVRAGLHPARSTACTFSCSSSGSVIRWSGALSRGGVQSSGKIMERRLAGEAGAKGCARRRRLRPRRLRRRLRLILSSPWRQGGDLGCPGDGVRGAFGLVFIKGQHVGGYSGGGSQLSFHPFRARLNLFSPPNPQVK
jgi:hypothetical protein